MWDVVLDALLDTLKLLPFLIILYIAIEFLEHKTAIGKPNGALNGKFAPLVGGATGLVPLCGFSVMAAKLYERRYITVGTLLAVFISTCDEAFIVLLSSGLGWAEKALSILAMCGVKFVVAVAVGYCADAVFKRETAVAKPFPEHDDHVRNEHEEDDHDGVEAHGHDHGDLSACEHKHVGNFNLYVLSPVLHALKVAAFVLLVNLAFGFLFYAAGEENVMNFLQAGYWYQPLIAAFIGLIPNCASSVVLAETYAVGGIAFGSCLAGLIANAGLGFVVLFKNVKEWKRNLALLAFLYALGAAVGYAVNAVALALPA